MAAPDGVDEALNGIEPPGARTIGALAVVRWAARDPGEPSEELDEGRPALTQGPYDEGDLDPEHTEADRVDFGAVRIPVPRGGQVSVEPEDGRLQAVHVMLPAGRLSVSALAAPRTARLWPDLAAEIDESLREGGATVRSFTGPWGRELHARTGEAASLFVGVDGPRWMLYGVATGPTGAAQELDTALRRMLRGVVVVRGRAPYPVRTVLPLTVPEHLAAAAEHPGADPAAPARNGRSVRRPVALGRPGAGPAAAPPRPRGTPAPPPTAAPDPGGVPTEPHGLRRVVPPGTNRYTNGYTNGRTPPANGSSVRRPLRDVDGGPAPRPLPDRRDALPTANGRPPAERPEQGVSATGQRRVADLLADAQRERAAQEAQREARERAAAREARERAAAEAQREARERAVREARERAAAEACERAAQEARERAAQERAAAEARERAAQERAAAEARERIAQERIAQERAAQERAAQEARERAAQERAAAEARERAARERAAAQPPSSAYRPAWSPAEPRPDLLAAPPLGAADPFGGRRPDDRRRDHHDDIAPLRLGGAPRSVGVGSEEHVPGWPASGRDRGTGLRPEPAARPADDGSEDWTLPIPVVPPEPEPAHPSVGQHGRSETDIWAGDPWAAEARRAARAARAAEGASERLPPPDARARREPDVERAGHHRPAHGRAGHHRAAHERGGDARAVDVPAARVPAPVPPAWAHVPDEWTDPFDDEQQSGRHRRPDR